MVCVANGNEMYRMSNPSSWGIRRNEGWTPMFFPRDIGYQISKRDAQVDDEVMC